MPEHPAGRHRLFIDPHSGQAYWVSILPYERRGIPGVIDRLRAVAFEAVGTGRWAGSVAVYHAVADQLSDADLAEIFERAIARG